MSAHTALAQGSFDKTKAEANKVGIFINLPVNTTVSLEGLSKHITITGDTMQAIAYLLMQLNKNQDLINLADTILQKVIPAHKWDPGTKRIMKKYILLREKQD